MNDMKFKTSIKCAGCLEKVAPELNKLDSIDNWDVDLKDPKKILTVNSSTISEKEVLEAVRKVGFEIDRV